MPVADDLLALIEIVNRCCSTAGVPSHPVLEVLLIDGGVSMTSRNGSLVRALARDGLVERTTLRRKDHPMPRRYSLTPRYMAAHLAFLDAVSGSDPQQGEGASSEPQTGPS